MLCAALLILAALPMAPAATAASGVPGAENPAFGDALSLWLDDEEAQALQAFSDLAHEGNRAAQIMLGLIDKSPALQGPWLAHLPRGERIALLRAEGGLSGRSWLAAASVDQPFAAAWMTLLAVEADLQIIARFTEMGEARAAREALVVLAAREHVSLRLAAPETVDPELLYLLWRTADPERRESLLAHVPPDHPQRAMMGEPRDESALARWLEHDPSAMPLAALCDARCPQSRAACLAGAYHALGSHNALLTLGSPFEALVSQGDFLASPRGQATVLRRILQSTDARGRRAMIGQIREHEECLADVLHSEIARYRYRRPGTQLHAEPAQD